MQIESLSVSSYFDQAVPYVGTVKPVIGEYGPEVARYASQYGVDADMVKVLIQEASGGAPNPITTAATADLLQLKPESTAELEGRALSIESFKRNAELYIELVCEHLAKSQSRRDGSIQELSADRVDPIA